jgi:hypothetical protein
MAGKLQNEDFKTEAELTGAGGSASQLLNDTKVYVTASGINKTLYDAIVDGDIGGGGGGGSIEWLEDSNAPIAASENFIRVYRYEAGLSQALYAFVKVPESYKTGNQLKLYTSFYSNDTSGTAIIRSVSTLIRPGTDLITSTTNQRTSTNAAVTLSGTTQNKPQEVILDLSSTIGQINAVGVSPGDLILIRLERGNDTATGELKVPVHASELALK